MDTVLEDTRSALIRHTLILASEAGADPRRVRNYGGWLEVENIRRNQLTKHTRQVSLSEIDIRDMESMQERLVNSNEDVGPQDLLWTFNLVWPDYVGAKCRKPTWWPNKLKNDKMWSRLWSTPENVNCLAFSLVHLMYWRSMKLFDFHKDGLRRATKKSLDLMEEMEWGVEVDLQKGLEKFVEVYSKYQVVVLAQHTLKTAPYRVFTGEDYTPNVDENGEVLKSTPCLLYVYMHIGVREKHVVGLNKVVPLVKKQFGISIKDTNYKWCYECHYLYHASDVIHVHLGEDREKEKEPQEKVCPKCNEDYIVGQHSNCPFTTCYICSGHYKKRRFGGEEHRCILYRAERKEEKNIWNTDSEPEGSVPALLDYDIESTMIEKPVIEGRTDIIREFNLGVDGKYAIGENGYVRSTMTSYDTHQCNFIKCKDQGTGEEWRFYPNLNDPDDDVLGRFIDFATYGYNRGNNTFLAHYGKGYDTVMVAQRLYEKMVDKDVELTRSGRKILKMTVTKRGSKYVTKFQDSQCHLPGSLANLAKGMCPGVLLKGYFPHKFNKRENYGYVGEVPAKEFFDAGFSAKSQKDMDVFDTWYEGRVRQGEWSFMIEMDLYLSNDVHVLNGVETTYAKICMDDFGVNPWKFMTGPQFCHDESIRNVSKNLNDAHSNWEDLRKNDKKAFVLEVTEAAKNETWVRSC